MTLPVVVPVLASAMMLAAGPCDPTAEEKSFWQAALRITGIAATPGQIRGLEESSEGDLYVTAADGKGARLKRTEGGGYRSPIFGPDDRHVLALRHGALVRVATELGVVAPEPLLDLTGVTRLAGLSEDDPNVLVVLREKDGRMGPALVCLTNLRLVELSDDHQGVGALLARLRSAERRYGDTVVVTKESDVVLRRPGQADLDVSRCGRRQRPPGGSRGGACSQGALSRDGQRVVYVRTLSQ